MLMHPSGQSSSRPATSTQKVPNLRAGVPRWLRGSLLTGSLLIGALLFGAGMWTQAPAAGQAPHEPGLEGYTPTKLEWVALELQAYYGHPLDSRGLAITYRPRSPDTIIVEADYLPQAGIDEAISRAVDLAKQVAADRKYTWLKIEQKTVSKK